MLALIKAWGHAVFVDPKVRAAFWGLVALTLGVEVPAAQAALGAREVFVLGVVTGWLIPHFREFATKQQAAGNTTAYDKLIGAALSPKSGDTERR